MSLIKSKRTKIILTDTNLFFSSFLVDKDAQRCVSLRTGTVILWLLPNCISRQWHAFLDSQKQNDQRKGQKPSTSEFLSFCGTGFERGASHLLGKCSTTSALPLVEVLPVYSRRKSLY
jgi:hypothetical protein